MSSRAATHWQEVLMQANTQPDVYSKELLSELMHREAACLVLPSSRTQKWLPCHSDASSVYKAHVQLGRILSLLLPERIPNQDSSLGIVHTGCIYIRTSFVLGLLQINFEEVSLEGDGPRIPRPQNALHYSVREGRDNFNDWIYKCAYSGIPLATTDLNDYRTRIISSKFRVGKRTRVRTTFWLLL